MAGSDNESDDASVHSEATIAQQQQNIQPQIITTVSNNNAKFPYLKKDEYEVWAMKMEYWITNNDMNIWKVIQNGNSLKRTGRDRDGRVIILPPTTADEHIAVQRESKARTTLLQSIPDDHVADFHYMDDARDIWNAVKARFGGNAESKKMRKSMLKQEFSEFRISEAEGLHKGYDRMQKILSQLNQLKAKPEDEDINLKFLRALPSSWSQVALTLKTKGGLELLSFDDLYYKLKTLEVDIKGYSTFSSSQSAGPSHSAFVSTTSASKKMSYADSPSYSSSTYTAPSNSKTGSHRSGNVIEDVLQSFVADTEPEQQLAYEDFEQIEKMDLEEMDLKWQMAMLSVRVHKFEQKAGRKIDFDKKESARFNKKKVRCYKCLQRGHFARECRAKGGNDKQRYSSFKIQEIGKKEEDSKALITVDTLVDWTEHDGQSDGVIAPKEFGMIAGCDTEDAIEEGAAKIYNLITGADTKEASTAGDAGEFALMGVTSEVHNCPFGCDNKYNELQKQHNELNEQNSEYFIQVQAYKNSLKTLEKQKRVLQKNQLTLEDKIRVLSIELENTTNLLKHSERINAIAETAKKELQTKLDNHLVQIEKWRTSSKNLFRLIDSSMSVRTKVGLGFNNYIRENELGWDDSAFSVFTTNSEEVESRPLFNRFAKADSMKALPPPLSGDYTPLSDHIDLDESQMSYGTKSSTSGDSNSVSNDFVSCDNSDKSSEVNTNDFASSDSSVKSSEPKSNDSTSCASTSSVSTSESEAKIKSNVGTPIQEPIIVQDLPSFSCNISDKNENTSRTSCNKNGYFNKKAGHFRKNASSVSKLCFVCGSSTHLIKDCDFYEKQMANKTVGNGVGPVHSRNNVNHQNQFVLQAVLLRTGKVNIPPARPQPVPTGKPKVPAPVPTGRQNRHFPVPTDRGYSPSVTSGWWKSNCAVNKSHSAVSLFIENTEIENVYTGEYAFKNNIVGLDLSRLATTLNKLKRSYQTGINKWYQSLLRNSKFGGNDESKKMQKYILKQQFKSFSVSNSEGLHKGYDRFQSLPSQLEIHGAGVSTEDANKKFLSTSSTNDVSTAYGISTSSGHNSQREGSSSYTDELTYSFFTNQSSSPQLDHEDLEQVDEFDLEEMDLKCQVAMISTRLKKFYKKTERKLHFDAKEPVGFDKTKVECFNCNNTRHFARECISKGNQENRRRDAGNTGYKAKDNGRRPGKQEEPKALVTLDGDGVDWTGHAKDEQENFALMAYSNSGLDAKMSARDKSGLGYGNEIHEGVLSYENEVLESVFNSRSSDVEDSPVNDRFANVEGMHAVPLPMTGIYMPPKSDIGIDESQFIYGPKQSKTSEYSVKTSDSASCESNSSVETPESMPKPAANEPKAVKQENPSCAFVNTVKHVKTHRETIKEQNTCSPSPKADKRDWNGLMSKRLGLGYGFTKKACFVCGSFSHLIRDCDFHEKRMAKQVKLNKQKGKATGQGENRPVWNNVQRLNHQNKFVPKAVLTKTGILPVNTARQTLSSQAATTSTARKVNTARPIVNEIRPRNNFYKSHSPIRKPFNRTTAPKANFTNHKVNTAGDKTVSTVGGNRETAVKASAGCNWRPKRHYWHKVSKYNSGSNSSKNVDPQKALKNKGIVDSGCSRHMTGNKAYLVEYQDYNGGPVAFGGSKGQITGKGKIITGKLDFEDVYFVKELKQFNLFSVSQMCDKKNKVLFTDSECLVLSPDFKLPDENQVLLRVPRQNNMYSFNLENIVPTGGLACLIAKATVDESNKWHRRLGHVNFKILNKLVKGNLVRGLPSKIFQNDHTCVACQKGKQHKAS
ncbi:ribonuclease H-like domain-containing protein, partial [Tanacetum coccineum]